MNERIRQLWEQAITIEDGGDYVCGELDPEKFAKLIVKECAEICWNEDFLTGNGYAEAIERHFGVGE